MYTLSIAVAIAGVGLAGTAQLMSAQEIPGSAAPPAGTQYVYEADRQRSSLFVVTHKSGLLGFLGHEHAIVPGDWTVDLCMDTRRPPAARGSIVIRTGSLVIDSDSARALAGLGEGPGTEDRADIQRTLADADHLAADEHPRITLLVDSTTSDADGNMTARGHLTIRGVTRPFAVPVTVETTDPGATHMEGTLRIRQSDYGMERESVAGVVNVADEVDLHIELVATRTDRPCAPPGGM